MPTQVSGHRAQTDDVHLERLNPRWVALLGSMKGLGRHQRLNPEPSEEGLGVA